MRTFSIDSITINDKEYSISDLRKIIESYDEKCNIAGSAYEHGFMSGLVLFRNFIASGGSVRQMKKFIMDYSKEDNWYKIYSYDENINYILEKIKNSLPEKWTSIRDRVLERDNHICHYCGGRAQTADHKKPVVSGGTWDDDNLVAACNKCNIKKTTMKYEDFIKKIEPDN